MKTQKTITGFSKYAATADGHIIVTSTGKAVKEYGRPYKTVMLDADDGTRKPIAVHRLVALAWHKNPDAKPEVDHIDGDKQNNAVSNLHWVTRSENTANPNTHVKRGSSFEKRKECVVNIKLDRETRALLDARAKENGRAACREAEAIIKKAVRK